MKNWKIVISDILYVSKLTRTQNKKILIFTSVLLSQLSVFTDVALIATFAVIIVKQYTNIELVNVFLELIIQNKFLIILIVILRFVFNYSQNIILKRIEENTSKNLKVYLLDEIFEKRNYSIADSYYYINVLSGHISFFYSSFASFLNSFFQIIAYSIYLLISNSKIVIIFFIGAAFILLPTRKLLIKAREYMHISYERGKESNEEIQKVVENLFLIKILKKDKDELKNFSQTLENFKDSMIKNHSIGLINGYLPSFITLITLSIVLTFTNYTSKITLDFIGVTLRLFQSLGSLSTSLNRIVNSQVHIEKFQDIDRNKIIQNKENYMLVENIDKISVKNLSFKYFNSSDLIFEGINFEIKKNTHTVIIGENGSGKSTLLGLLSGIYYSESGTITTFSKHLGYIGANPLIFSGTLRDNILYGNEKLIKDSEIISFLKKFNTFKEDDNYNLDNLISNKTLSSGQMQKIAFIRALISKVEILFLDEATANLDEYSKKLIYMILKESNITIINSTHDIESIKKIDNILKINIKNEKRSISFTTEVKQ